MCSLGYCVAEPKSRARREFRDRLFRNGHESGELLCSCYGACGTGVQAEPEEASLFSVEDDVSWYEVFGHRLIISVVVLCLVNAAAFAKVADSRAW